MKYFTKEFPKADNDPSLSKAQQESVHRKFLRNCRAYSKQLEKLRPRLSKQAWNFFYFGFARWGLHDARLLSFAAGDGLEYRADGRQPFRINKQKAVARIRILDRHQNLLCTFTCRGVSKAVFDYPSDDPLWDLGRIDDLLTYELTAADGRHLRLEFLFASGATILVEFTRLKFTRQRIRRRYPLTARYS
jgi:hypothetical protein